MRTLGALAAALSIALSISCGGAPPDVGSSSQGLGKEIRPPIATIVLLHGWGGFSRPDELNYFYGVADMYRGLGADVVVPMVPPINTIEDRAAQIKAQLDLLPGPFILLAHSQGGLDARYLVSRLGYQDKVLAVITIATPHHGTQVGDVLAGVLPAPVRVDFDDLLAPLGWSIEGIVEMSTWYMEKTFNPNVPDAEGVVYWSYSGKAAPFALGNNDGDLRASLVPGWTLLEAFHAPNDGVVPEASAHWGQYQGQLLADHLTEINHTDGVKVSFDVLGFYRNLLGRMYDQGW